MRVEVTLEGKEELDRRYQDIASETPIAMRKAINAAALMVKNTAIRSIKNQTPGEAYTRYDPKRTGMASRGKSAPNEDRGGLVRGMLVTTGASVITKKYEALVRSQAPYSLALEKGTGDMEKRPFMQPAIDANREKISNLVKRALREVLD